MIERKLWYSTSSGRDELAQAELCKRAEPLVILGEAGMGKSRLLEWLATSPEYALCNARQFINRYDAQTLLGDAQTMNL